MDGRSRTSGISRLATNPCPLTGGLHVASNNSGVITTMLLGLVLVLSVLALAVAVSLARWVLKQDNGTPEMRRVSDAIQEGAQAFLRRQYKTIGLLSIALAVLIYVLYAFFRRLHPDEVAAGLTPVKLALTTTFSFLFGALCSGVAGVIGMYVAVRSNIRTASAARTSLNRALQIALRGGAVSGLFVVAMSLLGVGGLYAVIQALHLVPVTRVPLVIVGYGFGASFVALFAQLGGGIYTKAADVGADLVGKVEAGIPEDDPRNPAVIADLVGDNVGDCAGRGADLFESTAAENIGAMILGAGLAAANPTAFGGLAMLGVILFPLVVRAFGLIASIIGILIVRSREDEDPMHALNRGYMATALLAAAGFTGGTWWLLNPVTAPHAWWHFALCGVIGIATSIAFVYITQYYTEYRYRPVQSIAAASVTGPATNIIAGFAVAMECTALPTFAIGAAILASYKIGASSGLEHAGLFGTAVATMGMLGTAAYILAMDTFGPITDNAGGVIKEVRRQFQADPGILKGTSKPDYGRAVDIVTVGALKEMVAPGLLAVGMPIAVGLFFKLFHVGAEAVAAFLMVGTIGGILVATMLNNGGGAWDNAKKFIETGQYGGQGSPAHKAGGVGGTVGEPVQDNAGPALHVLLKLVSTQAL